MIEQIANSSRRVDSTNFVGLPILVHRMGTSLKRAAILSAVLTAGLFVTSPAGAQSTAGGSQSAQARITQAIDSNSMVTLSGNVRAGLTPARDLGPVEDTKALRLLLVMKRSTSQQADLDNLIARQQEPGTAEYHKWLTPQEFGQRFGTATNDIQKISTWLEKQGFQVKSVLNNGSMIDFAATAGGVRTVFGTQLRNWNIEGGTYMANAQDPKIPAALASVVSGIKGLHNIPAHTAHTPIHPVSYDSATHKWHSGTVASEAGAQPAYLDSDGDYVETPQDFYTIYNVNPVFKAGNLGVGATIGIPEVTDMDYGTVNPTTGQATGGDVATFRKLFGVPGTLNMTVMHGAGTVTCGDPGENGAEGEAALDSDWSSALAPSAHLVFMSCDDSGAAGDGLDSAEMALVDNNISDVITVSYDNSELNATASSYAFLDQLYSQAASQGQSFLVAAGDSGSDTKDQNTSGTAVSGYNVSYFASSPLVTAVGGTDFQDNYDSQEGGLPQSTYWSAMNSKYYGDALSYIPETVWNSSCASSLFAKVNGFSGASYCAVGTSTNQVEGEVVGAGGGFSIHYDQPAYQTGTPGLSKSATKRAYPDVSLFAANGAWGHFLVTCDHEDPCTSPSTFGGAGGTSFATPQLAGIIGLLVTETGSRQGVLNPAFYALGKAQYTAPATATACYASGQTSNAGVTTGLPAATCIFHDVTTSNNDEPCEVGSTNCYVDPGADYGMLSLTNSSSLTVAYPAGPEYDIATGLGTINVANLLAKWNTAFTSKTALSANPTTITTAQSTTLKATVTVGTPVGYDNGTPPALSGTVSFAAGSTAVGNCTLSGGTCSTSVSGSVLALGSNSITATFKGSSSYPASTSSIVKVTVTSAMTGPTVITSQVTATPFVYNRATKTFNTTYTIKNTGSASAAGPISLVLTGLGSGVTVANATGTYNGSPYLTVSGSSLAVGASVSVAVQFSDPSNATIAPTPVVYSGVL